MNSHTEYEQFDIKCEKDFMSADEMKADIKIEPIPISEHVPSVKIISKDIESEIIKTEVDKCDYFSELFDNKQETYAISDHFSSIYSKSEVDETQESVDDPLQDDKKHVQIQKNNSGENQTTLNESIITYETDLEEKKSDHTRKEICTCVCKNYIFEHNHLNMCTQIVGKDFKCKNDKSYSSKSNFTEHIGDNLFSCSVCSKSFANKRSQTRHTLCHVGEKPFVCDICNESFSWKNVFKQHMHLHTGEKSFMCDFCSKSFARKSNLNLHIMHIHNGEKPFGCDVCTHSFCTRRDLKRHLRTHTGEKPFTCHICSKSYSRKSILNAHMCVHSGKMPFTCNICSKSFCRKYDLEVHMRYHVDDKSFTCNLCSKIFYAKDRLKRHMLTHTGEKSFMCNYCMRAFTLKQHLTQHMLIHQEKRLIVSDVQQSFS